MLIVHGAKAGQAQQQPPTIAADTVASISKIKILYILSEGEIKGLANGAASIMLDGTPLVDPQGVANFKGVEWEMRHGTPDQTHIPGLTAVSNEIGINTAVRSGTPWVRAVTDIELDSVNVNVSWARLSATTEKFDVIATTVAYAIDVQTDGGGYVTVLDTSIKAKTSGRYQRTHNIKLPRASTGWQIRVRKITADSDNEKLFNAMQVDTIAEIVDVKLRYPNSALLYLSYNAQTFSNIPKLSVAALGRYVQIPTNYNEVTRKSIGLWDGTFKQGYTNNPAWVLYDLITNDRYGLGDKLKPFMINKWALENIARICDQEVSDGKGGTEPRHTCNLYLQQAEDAYRVIQHISGIFRGLSFWDGSQIIIEADSPRDTDYVLTRANVIDGMFIKTGTPGADRHTIAKVAFSDPNNAYATDYVMVRNEAAIAQYGINVIEMAAVGCTSEGQAYRMGLAALLTEQNRTQTVTFSMGLEGALPTVGSRVDISDPMFTGKNTGGRISSVSADRKVITLDRDGVPAAPGDRLIVNLENGKAQARVISKVKGRAITVAAAFDAVASENVWTVDSATMPVMPFIVLSVTGNEDMTQYSYVALQYDPGLHSQIDNGTLIDNRPPIPIDSFYNIAAPATMAITSRERVDQGQRITTLVLTWAQVPGAVSYNAQWRKDGGDWITLAPTGNISAEIDGVYAGNYTARVSAVGAMGQVSKYTDAASKTITGRAGTPAGLISFTAAGLLFGTRLNWAYGPTSGDAAYVEIEIGTSAGANVSVLGLIAHPTTVHEITGMAGGISRAYRGRIVDRLGNKSPWSAWVTATSDDSTGAILELLNGEISSSQLNQELTTNIAKITTNANDIAAEVLARGDAIIATTKKITDETAARAAAITATTKKITGETAARSAALLAQGQRITDETAARSAELLAQGKRITDEANARATDIAATTKKITDETAARSAALLAQGQRITDETNARAAALLLVDDGIKTETTQRKAADTAINSTLTTYVSKTDANVAAVAAEITARTTADTALSTRIDTVVAQTGDNTAAVTAEATARTNADSALSTRIDTVTAESGTTKAGLATEVTARTNADTALTKRIDTVTAESGTTKAGLATEVTARTTADTALSTRIDTVTATAGTNKAGITALTKTSADADTALSTRIDTVTAESGTTKAGLASEITARTTADTALTKRIDTVTAESGTTTAGLATEITARTTADTALSTRIDTVTATAGTNKASITALTKTSADADTAMSSRVDTVTATANATKTESAATKAGLASEITARTNADTALSTRIDTVTAESGTTKAGLATEVTARTTADTALSTRIDTVTATAGTNKAGITALTKTSADADTALSTRIDTVTAESGTTKAGLASEITARADADTALTSRIDTVTAQAGTNKSGIASEITARTNADSALSTRIDTVTAESGTTKAGLATEVTARTTADSALSTRIDTVTATAGTNKASITALTKTSADADTAMSSRVDTVTATANATKTESAATKAGLASEITARTNADTALSTRIDTVTAESGTTKAGLATEVTARTTADTALSTRIDTVTATAGTNKASITALTKTSADADTAMSSRVDTVTATANATKTESAATKAGLATEVTARTNADSALSTRIDTVTAQAGTNKSGIASEITARTNADSALSTRIDTVTAQAGTNKSGIATLVSTTASQTAAIATLRTDLTASFTIEDTRATDELPQYYYTNYPRQTAREFKQNNTFAGVVGTGTYIYVETIVKWTTASGGAIVQTAITDDNRIYVRTSLSATAWRPWIEQEDTVGAAAKVAAAKLALEGKISAADAKITAETQARAGAMGALTLKVDTLQTTVDETTVLYFYNLGKDHINWGKDYNGAGESTATSTVWTIGNNAGDDQRWMIRDKDNIPLVDGQIYRISCKYRNVSGAGTTYVGVAGIAANGTSFVAANGTNNAASAQYYIDSDATTSTTLDEVYGYICSAATDTTGLTNVKKLHANAKFFRPLLIANYQNLPGSTQFDWFKVEAVDKTNTASIQTTQKTVDGLKAQYTVKLDVGGRVSGFGLASSATQSDFAINADKFYIAPPTGKAKGTSPFMVLTAAKTINGTSVPAGTYIQSAFIHNGSIDTAKIKNLSVTSAEIANGTITTAKIGNAQVDTLQIKGEAVTVPRLTYIPNPIVFLKDNVMSNGARYASVYVASPPEGVAGTFHAWTYEMARTTFDAQGGSVSVTFAVDGLYALITLVSTPLPAPQFFEIQFKRGDVVLRVKRGNMAQNVAGKAQILPHSVTLPTILDAPPVNAGAVTYTAEIVFYASARTGKIGGSTLKDFRTATDHEIGFETAACQILGVKR